MWCRRCQGLMVWDRFFDPDEEGWSMAFSGWRCVSCGEIVDPVILANRAKPPAPRKRRPRHPRLKPLVFDQAMEPVGFH